MLPTIFAPFLCKSFTLSSFFCYSLAPYVRCFPFKLRVFVKFCISNKRICFRFRLFNYVVALYIGVRKETYRSTK